MKLTLTTKFSIAVMLTLLVVFTLGGAFFARAQQEDLLSSVKASVIHISDMVADSVSSLVTEIEFERAGLQRLTVELASLPGVDYVEIFENDSNVIAHTNASRVGGMPSAEHVAAIRQVFSTGRPYDLSMHPDNRYIHFLPIHGKADTRQVIGVVGVSMDRVAGSVTIDNLVRVVQSTVAQQFAHIRTEQNDLKRLLEIVGRLEGVELVDIYQEQLMLIHGDNQSRSGEEQALVSARVKEVFRAGRAVDTINFDEGWYQRYSPIYKDISRQTEVVGVVMIKMNLSQVSKVIAELRNELIVTALTLAIALLVMLVAMVRYFMIRPLRELGDASRAIGRGDFEREIHVESRDELGELARSFSTMAMALKQSQSALIASRDEMERGVISRTAELYSEKHRLQVTLSSIGDAVISTDADSLVEFLNPAAEYLTGWRSVDAEGHPLTQVFRVVDELSYEPLPDALATCLRGEVTCSHDRHAMLISREGKEIAVESTVSAMRDDMGLIHGAVVVFRDVGVERRLRRQLQYQANHDALTGLQNRRMFEEALERAVADAHTQDVSHVVLFLDLDQFKVVNDTCGHMAGDALLTQLTGLLREKMRGSDILARLGGDEFGVILRDCRLAQGKRVAKQLLGTVRDFRFVWEKKSFDLGVSIGLVLVDQTVDSVAAVMSAADVACYAAKDGGRNRVHVYQADDSDLVRREGEMQWVSLISKALQENRFLLYHQLIQSLQQEHGVHCEILLRMQDEQGNLIPPGAFIPAAERYNLMASIDRWVIREVFAHYARHWNSRVLKPHMIAINLSGISLNDPGLYDYISGQLDAFGLPGAPFCFEVTETAAVANLSRASELIRKLKALGCSFALDDFGCGVSSFGYLKNLPVDYLKIDGGFVRDMARDRVDHAMVEAINHIGHVMGLKTIAEYVEDEPVMEALRRLGVNYGQGYYIARPAPLAEFDVLIARRITA